MRYGRFIIFLSCLLAFGCSSSHDIAVNTALNAHKEPPEVLVGAMKAIEPFFKPMGKPAPYDWLGSHKEPGQTFEQYINEDPTLPTAERRKIYVLPLGSFNTKQQKVITVATAYLEAFYGLPVERMPPRTFSATSTNIRYNNYLRTRQVKTGYILNDVLPKILPDDAAALIAFTTNDLYPDESMNYVFGQASMETRVGVWSLYRLGDHANYDTFLRRTLKIAAHETGHMFSMRHCIKYECVMNGTNQLAETDSRPIDACPDCMAKIAWLSKIDPKTRYDRLAAFSQKNGLTKEADEFIRKSASVGNLFISQYPYDIGPRQSLSSPSPHMP
jgi:archaemetzincin